MKVFLKLSKDQSVWFDIYNANNGENIGYIHKSGSGVSIAPLHCPQIDTKQFATAKYLCEYLSKQFAIDRNDLNWLRKAFKDI